MNMQLFAIIFSIAFTVLIGLLMIVAFVTGFDKGVHIIGTVIAGTVISLPISVVVTKKLSSATSGSNQ